MICLDLYDLPMSSFRIKSELIPIAKHLENRHAAQILLDSFVMLQFPAK